MNLNQLTMLNIAPRGIAATCVPTSICFATGSCYHDVEEVLVREQPKNYRPDIKGNRGVDSEKLLGKSRTIFGHKFTKMDAKIPYLGQLPSRLDSGTYLVTVPGHMLVVKNNQIFDLSRTAVNATVRGVWKVEKA